LGKFDKRNICGKRQENKRHFWKISKIFVDIEGLKYGREFEGENVVKFVPLFERRLRDRKLSRNIQKVERCIMWWRVGVRRLNGIRRDRAGLSNGHSGHSAQIKVKVKAVPLHTTEAQGAEKV
jgi:hypothetical protein